MSEEQASLVQQLPRLMRALADGGWTRADGSRRTGTPTTSVQVGVVDSDMGTGGYLLPTCAEENFGDDGILRTRGNTAIAGCAASYPAFLSFAAGDDDAAFAADLTCVVVGVGTEGCGFEQHLDSVLKALTPSTSSTTFAMGTRGHADVQNAGFARSDSVLGVIILADEDDCSAADGDIFDRTSARYMGDLNLRCSQFPEALYSASRYVNGLTALRPGHPERLVYGAIVGVPTDLVADSDAIDYSAVLSDPRMQQAADPSMPSRLMPSCNTPGRGLAFPPVRMTQVAQGLHAAGAHAVVQSICQADFTSAMDAILDRIFDALDGGCTG
ncbi:MAG: hypothetical protein GXP55_10200 [Deltaproteobacteria bacterium]|nr:hypothetical protein [Deltaproteobacteria bacterium]